MGAEAVSREGERYLKDVLQRMGRTGDDLHATSQVLDRGPTVEAVREEADRVGADLIVMTTHGRGGLQRAWFGSVAEGIVRGAKRPVLLVRPTENETDQSSGKDPVQDTAGPFRRILVPLDGSTTAKRALDLAKGLAGASDATLILLHVVSPQVATTYPFRSVPIQEDSGSPDEGERWAREDLEETAAPLRESGLSVETGVRRSHHPGLEILGEIGRSSADLVVMTTRGHGAAGRLLLGSVADKVLRGAQVPVLLQRTEAEMDEADGGA